ncbi:peptidase family C78-domain-containing protein [Hyaloscypha finlandica]|nr:peptidase family C78-domain-containing protein [Hyaloscypha finlandica]
MEEEGPMSCPFCGIEADGDYQIMLHLETVHPEDGESPFVVKDDASIAALMSLDGEKDDRYANCPVEGCGEALLLTELESHIEMHEEEQDSGDDQSSRSSKRLKHEPPIEAAFDTKLSHALRNLEDVNERLESESPSSDRQAVAKATWKSILKMPDSSSKTAAPSSSKSNRRRLGKSELGPHAHEKQMPSWLVKLLQEQDGAIKSGVSIDNHGNMRKVRWRRNMAPGIIPVLEQLLEQDVFVEFAYLCDPAVRHVSKLKREGGFCGYRNIQMICSYIIGAESQGYEHFKGKIPSIFDIQENIEHAWDLGINAQGRIETGGIRGTRKYIGTPDAQAMFCCLGIACDAQGLKPKGNSRPAYDLLFNAVEQYFVNGCADYNPKVRCTSLPPIYFQHPGHSMTIVGFERKVDGSKNILVFDPMFHDSSHVTQLIGLRPFILKQPAEDVLRAYRRGAKYLKKYSEFELLK